MKLIRGRVPRALISAAGAGALSWILISQASGFEGASTSSLTSDRSPVTPPGGAESSLRGGWHRLLDVGANSTWYTTRLQAMHEGDLVTLWRRIEFRSTQPADARLPVQAAAYLSLAEQVQVNCAARTETILQALAFRTSNLVDPIGPPPPVARAARSATPGSGEQRFIELACTLFQPRRMQPL